MCNTKSTFTSKGKFRKIRNNGPPTNLRVVEARGTRACFGFVEDAKANLACGWGRYIEPGQNANHYLVSTVVK